MQTNNFIPNNKLKMWNPVNIVLFLCFFLFCLVLQTVVTGLNVKSGKEAGGNTLQNTQAIPFLRGVSITADIPGSGVGAYYRTYYDGIVMHWANPANGNTYKLLLKAGAKELVNYSHGIDYALIDYNDMDLSGMELLVGRFSEFDSTNIKITDLNSFQFDLSGINLAGNPTASPAPVQGNPSRPVNVTAPNEWTQSLSGDFTDSDKDGMTDAAERKYGFNPYDKNSFPPEAIFINTNSAYPDVPITGSGNGAVYRIVEADYIRIKWQNPANGSYALFLYNNNYRLYRGDHQTTSAEVNYAVKFLKGTEFLNGYFIERDAAGQTVQTLPVFYLDLNTITFGAQPTPAATHTIGSADNRITYSFRNFGSVEETAHRSFLRKVFPILYEKLGPPAESFNCEINNTGSLAAFHSTNRGRVMITNGNLLPQVIVHELVHAWKGEYVLSAGAHWEYTYNLAGFEEGSAQGLSFEIIHEFVRCYPDDPVTYMVMSNKTGQYWDIATVCYDFINKRRYMGGGDLWSGGLAADRYCVAGTTFQIMETENPGFYRDFMAKYFAKINADAAFRPTKQGLISLMAEVNPYLNGVPTNFYLENLPVFQGASLEQGMYVINTSQSRGKSALRYLTASYANRNGELFWAIPDEQMQEYNIPGWVNWVNADNNYNYIDMQNQPFSVSVFDLRNQIIKTVRDYTIIDRNPEGIPTSLGRRWVEELDQQFFVSGLYKMIVAFDNFTTHDLHAMEEEYFIGLNGINQDKQNEYVILIGFTGIENGSVAIELNGKSYSAPLSNNTAFFRSYAWPFDLAGQFMITVNNSQTGVSHSYYRTIVEAGTYDNFFQHQFLIVDEDFNGIEEF